MTTNLSCIFMKKIAIVCAVVMATALSLTSCGDTNYCYEVTTTYTLAGQSLTTNYNIWCTSNELDAMIEQKEAAFEKLGYKNMNTTYKKNNNSKSDCK